MSTDPIREAFTKAKQDILDLKSFLITIQNEIQSIKSSLNDLKTQQSNQQTNQQTLQHTSQHINPSENQTNPLKNTINQQENQTNTLNEPYITSLEALKPQFLNTSTGNRGVPTNRQTNQQTNQQTDFTHKIEDISAQKPLKSLSSSPVDKMIQLSNTLSELDDIKRTLYHQIKSLTPQEMLVFSSIYQFQEEGFNVDYPFLASKLHLSESSIREYTLKLIQKGVPIEKTKVNNKKIMLQIPESLRKLASLTTILALREI